MRKLDLFRALALLATTSVAAYAAATAPAADGATRIIHIAASKDGPVNQRMTMSLDKAAIIELHAEAHDVLVSNPEIVDAVVRSPHRIFLLAAKSGQTNAFFFDAAGRQILSLDIRVEKDVTDLGSLMKASMPNSAISVAA